MFLAVMFLTHLQNDTTQNSHQSVTFLVVTYLQNDTATQNSHLQNDTTTQNCHHAGTVKFLAVTHLQDDSKTTHCQQCRQRGQRPVNGDLGRS